MKHWIQFLREIEQRLKNKLEADYIIPVVGSSQDFDSEMWKAELAEKHPEYKDYPYCVIMPAAGIYSSSKNGPFYHSPTLLAKYPTPAHNFLPPGRIYTPTWYTLILVSKY